MILVDIYYMTICIILKTLTIRLSSYFENVVHRKRLKSKGRHMLSKIELALLLPSCRTDFRMGKAYGQRTQPTHAARKIPSLIPSIYRSERHIDVNIQMS